VLALTHLTHDSEPRGEMQAASGERSENHLSSQRQRRDARQTAQQGAELIRGTAMRSGRHLLSTRDLDLFSFDDWQKFTAETIEIRKMVYTYRSEVPETPDDE
jgi:hypothetical protein